MIFIVYTIIATSGALAAPTGDRPPDVELTGQALHAWMAWAAYGVMFPAGTILITLGANSRGARQAHGIVQVVAALTATSSLLAAVGTLDGGGAHSRIGVALILLVLVQVLLAAVRPGRESSARHAWWLVHVSTALAIHLLSAVALHTGLGALAHPAPYAGILRFLCVFFGIAGLAVYVIGSRILARRG